MHNSVREKIEKYLHDIEHGDRTRRLDSLMWLTDVTRAPHPVEWDLEPIVGALETLSVLFLAEEDETVEKKICHAIRISMSREVGRTADFGGLVARLDQLGPHSLVRALGILKITLNPEYRESVSRFRDHPDAQVRKEAREALAAIPSPSEGEDE